MTPSIAALVLLGIMFFGLTMGVWIGISLAAVGFVAMELMTTRPIGLNFASSLWSSNNSWTLTALPMFIWMGEILFRSKLAEDMFRGLAPWVQIVAAYALLYPQKIPPRDAMMSLSEKLWESRRLIPTVLLIFLVLGSIYGGLATPTESAVLGVVGALILSGIDTLMERRHMAVLAAALALAVMLGVSGVAQWDQVGSLFVVGLLVYTAAVGGISWNVFKESALGATRTNCMIALILSGAAFLSTAMGFTGLPRLFADWIVGLNLGQAGFIAALTVIFMIMGCFIDGISMVVLTTAVILPAVKAAGIDLLWFGIFIVLVVEMAQITPPVGFNLYVLQSLAQKSMGYVALASLPFFIGMIVMVAIVYAVPDLVSWLPNQMLGRK